MATLLTETKRLKRALGPLLVTRALLQRNLRLAVSLRGSAFVAQVTSRIGSISDNSSGGAYAHRASKGALNVFTKSLAIDLEPQNIGCLLLHPGNVSTAYNSFNGAVEPEESARGWRVLLIVQKLGNLCSFFILERETLSTGRRMNVVWEE